MSLSPFAPENWHRETGSAVPSRVSLLIHHTQAESVLFFSSHLQPVGPVAILPVVTKDIPISPRFTPYDFFRDASSALLQLVH